MTVVQTVLRSIGLGLAATASLGFPPASADTIVDEWATVQAPPAPALKPAVVDPKTTALLMLDFVQRTCNTERRPRCAASVPKVQGLLREARDKGALVVHSLAPGAAASSILPDLAPREGEPVVASGPDKFLGTDLERILADKGIRTVIVVGTAAHGAVLHTASAAALRGLDVVAPVDGMSAEEAYPEQYTAWHLANAPRIGERVTLTSIDRVRY
jgi:nicotinamidase-related amidase